MEQLSLFDEKKVAFPLSHDDVRKLHKQYIDEGEKDEDAFTWKEIKNGYSYYFYGIKVMEHTVLPSGKVRFCIKQNLGETDEPDNEKDKGKFIPIPSDADLLNYMEKLKKAKHLIFRNTITDTFGCCNDFERCSDALKCIHAEDRFYNGCMYRKNLEAGRVFYGKNKNNE